MNLFKHMGQLIHIMIGLFNVAGILIMLGPIAIYGYLIRAWSTKFGKVIEITLDDMGPTANWCIKHFGNFGWNIVMKDIKVTHRVKIHMDPNKPHDSIGVETTEGQKVFVYFVKKNWAVRYKMSYVRK